MTSSSQQLAEGQATYGMANLRPERTGLPFIVFISQRDDAKHAARVKVSPAPEVIKEQMASYAVHPVAANACPAPRSGSWNVGSRSIAAL